MLEANLRRIDYGNLHIFVGTYPNDPATRHEVELVRARYPNVHQVVCPHDGPTNKSDCLNGVYEGILAFEKECGLRFDVFAMNDSEDVIHPQCFKLFNCLVPRYDMVQIPVIPLEVPWWHFTAGHYLDEFAENHGKDMVVRRSLTGTIPAAGVGCAFSRRALELATAGGRELFSAQSLAEDFVSGAPSFVGQYYPYTIEGEAYGYRVLPDNLGPIEPNPNPGYRPLLPADLIRFATKNLVVRDGFASFFYDPTNGPTYLDQTIAGIKSAGYTFVGGATIWP